MMKLQNLLSPPREELTTSNGFPETRRARRTSQLTCPSRLFIFLRFTLFLFICICLYVTSAQVSSETRRHCILWDIELLDIGTGNWQAVRACHL